MRLKELSLQNYRNIRQADFTPCPELTVICGKNGQGKTNLLEAVWLLTGGKSFRGAKDAELIARDQPFSVLEAETETSDGQQNQIYLTVGGRDTPRPGRTAKRNGVDLGRASALAGSFTAVVFEPGNLSLVKGSPEGRRRFLDAALCQLYPGYLAAWRRYARLLTQKNALLKHYERTPGAAQMLDVFDEELARYGQELTLRRMDYMKRVRPLAIANYRDISQGSEGLELVYQPSFGDKGLLETLRESRRADLKAGFSTAGPHREDFTVLLDGQPAKLFASQGQQRSTVLSLKLAEASCAQEITGEHPVMLLDDVLSELDATRQEYLLTRMRQKQTIVTACDSSLFHKTEGELFRMEGGVLEKL